MQRAVFLDKDGTLLVDVPYNVDPARVRLAPGAVPALRRLAATGYALVVVSNQAGVARGLFTLADLARLDAFLRRLLAEAGVPLAGAYYCPHYPGGRVAPFGVACACRKPRPGLLQQAARELGLDLHQSWMIGDILHDVEAGRRAGCRTVLLDVGSETEWQPGPERVPHRVAPTWEAAAQAVLAAERSMAARPPRQPTGAPE